MRLIAIFLVSLLSNSVLAMTVDNGEGPDATPTQVLVLTGGGYHDFQGNTSALLEGLRAMDEDAFAFEVMWLGDSDEAPDEFRSDRGLDDPTLFTSHDVVLAYCQGDLGFTEDVKRRFLSFIRGGGGYVAIHSAADSHPGWDAYDDMLGGRFESHPPVGEMSVQIDVPDHEITRGLPTEWTLIDEFYHLKRFRTDGKLVLMTGRSPGDTDDAPLRPVTWEKNYGQGRVFYTILGHERSTFTDDRFVRLIHHALQWTSDAPQPDSDGVYHLFDGISRNGWSMAGPGDFLVEDGHLVAQGGMGMLWYHERRFRDFTLSVEWMTQQLTDNSGVFVRFAKPSNDPWYAVHHGHEIQILDDPDAGPTRGTGSIYAHADAATGAAKPPGEWNVFEITVRGDDYTVVLNGETICQWTSPTDRHGREGYIGLQNHGSAVRFRNIRVMELAKD